MRISDFFARKKQTPPAAETKNIPEWERFDLAEFATGPAVAAGVRTGQTLTTIPRDKEPPSRRRRAPQADDADLSFDELMAQYHDYEREVDGGSETVSSKGPITDDTSGRAGAARQTRDRLQASRSGKEPAVGSRAPIATADVDRRAGPSRRGMERPGSDDGRSARGSVRWASDGGDSEDSEAHGPAAPGRRPASHEAGSGMGSSGLRRTVMEEMAGQSEPMGDALMLGAKGFINLGKRGLLSLPMGAYTGAMLGDQVRHTRLDLACNGARKAGGDHVFECAGGHGRRPRPGIPRLEPAPPSPRLSPDLSASAQPASARPSSAHRACAQPACAQPST